jgi:hypothetical protein
VSFLVIVKIVDARLLFHRWVNKHRVKKISTKEAELHKFEFHVREKVSLGSLLPVDGVFSSPVSLGFVDTCHVPDAFEFDEVSDQNEKNSEIHLRNKKVFLEDQPFSDRRPVYNNFAALFFCG